MNYLPDHYTFKARWQPAFLVLWPIVTTLLVWAPGSLIGWKGIYGLIALAGLPQLLGQLARDAGKSVEPTLFRAWGGCRTVARLRHREAPNTLLLKARHEKLARLTEVPAPTVDEERKNHRSADEVYETYTTILKNVARDTSQDRLVSEENRNYGFRRNALGLKPFALPISVAAALLNVILFIYDWRLHSALPVDIALICFSNLFLAVIWLCVIKPDWVKTISESYADRLLEVADRLQPENR